MGTIMHVQYLAITAALSLRTFGPWVEFACGGIAAWILAFLKYRFQERD